MPSTKKKNPPSLIKGRIGTLIYEFSKLLAIPHIDLTTDEDIELKHSILNMNDKCEYCEMKDATTMDHFMCLVKNSKPTEYCNDIWNLVPCCKECNSSKGGRTFEEWFNGKGKRNPYPNMNEAKKKRIYKKMSDYTSAHKKYHCKKIYNEAQMKKITEKLIQYFEEIQEDINDMYSNTTHIRCNNVLNHSTSKVSQLTRLRKQNMLKNPECIHKYNTRLQYRITM